MNQLHLFLPCAAGVESYLAEEVRRITGVGDDDLRASSFSTRFIMADGPVSALSFLTARPSTICIAHEHVPSSNVHSPGRCSTERSIRMQPER